MKETIDLSRYAEHAHDPDAVARVQGSVLARQRKRDNLKAALLSFGRDELAQELADAMASAYGLGPTLTILDRAVTIAGKAGTK